HITKLYHLLDNTLPDIKEILIINPQVYKRVPDTVKLELYQLYNNLFSLMIYVDNSNDNTHMINIFKMWIMINKIILYKLPRGGSSTSRIIKRKIYNINNGLLNDEWKKLCINIQTKIGSINKQKN